MPPSNKTIDENGELIVAEILKARADINTDGHNRPVVVIAHSMGGGASFSGFIRNSGILGEDVVSQVILAESVISGAPFADFVVKNIDTALVANPLYRFLKHSMNGLISMTKNEIQASLATTASLLKPEFVASVSKRIFYVRGAQESQDLPAPLKPNVAILERHGENDGMIPTENQKIEAFAGEANFGTDLGVLHGMNHFSFFVAGKKATHEQLQVLNDFTLAVIKFATGQAEMRTSIDLMKLDHGGGKCLSLFF